MAGWCASARLGVDIPDDGEFGKPVANYDYGVWWNYAFAHAGGFVSGEWFPVPAQVGRRGARLDDDRQAPRLAEVQQVQDPESGTLPTATRPPADAAPVVCAIKYVGHAMIAATPRN